MNNFRKMLPFAMPYKKYAYLNIFFNILYALFSTLSFIALIPMMKVLFDQTKRNTVYPQWKGILKIEDYGSDLLSYFITYTNDTYGQGRTLAYMVVGIISIFLLKNLCDYLAMFFVTFLRNGMLRDVRNAMYRKIVELPLAFYSEKRKGDVISRISGDVNEVQNSMLAILELMVKEPLTIIFTIVAMFMISVKLTLFVFIF